MKHVKMFGKSVPLIAIVLVGLLTIGGVSAVLLDYYGFIRGTVDVKQSVIVDGNEDFRIPIVETFGNVVVGGDTVCRPHTLLNRAGIPASVSFGTTITPAVDGITVKYLEPVDYSYEETIQVDLRGTGFAPLELIVEDDGTWVTWTFDFPKEGWDGDANLNVGLIIALDGEGEGPAYQIHNTDSNEMTLTDGTPLIAGTWAMSPWGPTIDDGWNGWHSGDTNTLVSDLDWVEATGLRNLSPDGVLTVRIKRAELGNEFHWAASPTVGSGSGTAYDVTMQVPPAFNWDVPIVGEDALGVQLVNYMYADLYEDIVEPLTLEPGVLFNFKICYTFPINVAEEHIITTTVDVA